MLACVHETPTPYVMGMARPLATVAVVSDDAPDWLFEVVVVTYGSALSLWPIPTVAPSVRASVLLIFCCHCRPKSSL